MANTYLKPFRQYDEHDVINLFTYDITSITAVGGVLLDAGRCVKISTGWQADDDQVDLSTNASGTDFNNVLSTTWSLTAKLSLTSANTDHVLGINLVKMCETDENGEKLIYNPRKAVEMGVVVPGQSIPVLTRGLLLYKSDSTNFAGDTIAAGETMYSEGSGFITNDLNTDNVPIGMALGAKTSGHADAGLNGWVLLKIDL